uniref:Proclotting enzyme n=1 Tax=Aceria tosichella TaxID=561515 RepID=A0A6G1SL90_9ACAR
MHTSTTIAVLGLMLALSIAFRSESLSIGGEELRPRYKLPFLVALRNATQGSKICGGSIYSKRVIITAKHCMMDEAGNVDDLEHLDVGVGCHRFDDCIEAYHIDKFEVLDNLYLRHDIMLLHTNRDIAFGEFRDPYNQTRRIGRIGLGAAPDQKDSRGLLPQVDYNKETKEILGMTGWGFIDRKQTTTKVPREVFMQVKSHDQCLKEFEKGEYVSEENICAGSPDGVVCQGDSGSPVYRMRDERFELVGVVQGGNSADDDCGKSASLIEKISFYSKWIEEVAAKWRGLDPVDLEPTETKVRMTPVEVDELALSANVRRSY